MRFAAARTTGALFLLLCVAVPSRAQESFPTDVACDTAPAVLRNSAFKLVPGAVELREGKGCLKETAASPRCDWTVDMTRAEWWGATPRFLLVVLNSSHESGSGEWDSVFLARCQGSRLVPAFSKRYLYGAKIDVGKSADFRITSHVWRKGDSECCPSTQRVEHYIWDERRRLFVTMRQ
ncbi:MAG TPA: hypothetical protein VN716_01150 [Vicinamibacterales bacterium]|jgi:hypothetical protein|nr:hypothetical protein [Vicinamibacterales bacterium]